MHCYNKCDNISSIERTRTEREGDYIRMSDYSIFSERVKLQLEKNNISQRELAEKTGITEATISRYISSKRIPKATEILKIAKVLNCTSDFLLGIDSKGIKNISLKDAIYNLEMNRPFMESEWQKTIDIAINAIEKQIQIEKYCSSTSCEECSKCPNDFY